MPITKSGQFFTWNDSPFGPSLGIDTINIDNCITEIIKENYESIFGCSPFGFKQDNFEFLKKIPHIRYIHFWEVCIKNIDGLYNLKNLEHFSVGPKRPAINFIKFPKLKKVIWDHKKKDTGINQLHDLKVIDLWRYKSPSYETLELPDSLEYMEVNWSDPENLKSLKRLSNLKELQIHFCRNLKSLNGIKEHAPNIEKLVITNCKNLEDISDIKKLKNLKHAWIQDKQHIP